jgi:hypothetical protein
MKRILILALLSLVFAFRAPAQATNCSVITFNTNSISADTSACASSMLGMNYNQTYNFGVYCYNTQTNVQYNPQAISLGTTGYCHGTVMGTAFICPPTYTWTKVTPLYASGYNQLYFTGMNGSFFITCVTYKGATILAQCLTQACTSGGTCNRCGGCTPVLIDTTGQGFSLTDVADGVSFPMAGTPQPMGWTAKGSGDAFLALPGPDGLVHDGSQLFGNFTPQPPSATPNGFAALAVYDLPANGGNGDGIIDAKDGIWNSLRLWIDANHDGICQIEEMHTLPSLGITSLSLKYRRDSYSDQYGNMFIYRASVNPDNNPSGDPVGRVAYDVSFVFAAPTTVPNLLPNLSQPGTATPAGTSTSCWLLMPWNGGKC